MGILNVTPDSFSDGGLWTDPGAAVRHAFEMVDQGAGVIDIGAESTRPNASPVTADEELARLEPVLRELVPSVDVPISVDTMKAEVAERCIELGATIVNDVLGLAASVKVREEDASISLRLPGGLAPTAESTCQSLMTGLMVYFAQLHDEYPDNIEVLEDD